MVGPVRSLATRLPLSSGLVHPLPLLTTTPALAPLPSYARVAPIWLYHGPWGSGTPSLHREGVSFVPI